MHAVSNNPAFSCTYYLFSVAIVGRGNQSVVWSTNVGHLVKEGATLQLIGDRELVLQNSNGDHVWSTNTLGKITSLSCPRPFDQKHYLVEVRNVSYFNLIDEDAAFPNISDMHRCREICLLNCSCGAVFFRYNNNVLDRYCYIPSTVLTIREGLIPNHSFASAKFVKVQMPYKPANGQVECTVRDISPPASRRNLKTIIARLCVGALLIFVVIIVTCFVMLCPRCLEDEDCMKQVPGSLVRFSYEQLCVATKDFKERLGGGALGIMFKGMLEDGTQIAAKRLDKLGQGMKEFFAEVETLGHIHHVNIVRLIRFCAEKSCRLLVNEYMTNGSLDNRIFWNNRRPCLNWQRGCRNFESTQSESRKHLLQVLLERTEYQLLDMVENIDEGVKQYHAEEVVKMIKIGAWCLQINQSRRPSMSIVVKVLKGLMEVDININYNFTYATASSSTVNNHASTAPPASVLSNPR
ncbi:hypothetical protein ACSBR1_027857 [Camellia fascicularis]